MSEFSREDNCYKYDYFDIRIYKFAVKNKHIDNNTKKFLIDGKLIMDDLILNKNKKSRFLNIANSEKFKEFIKTMVVSCLVKNNYIIKYSINNTKKFKYDLNILNINTLYYFSNNKNCLFPEKIISSFHPKELNKFGPTTQYRIGSIKFSANYEGLILATMIVYQYLLESFELIGTMYLYDDNTDLSSLCRDDLEFKYFNPCVVPLIKSSNSILVQYFVLKYIYSMEWEWY